ncbi:hypothetical protein V5O48_018439 [Marasmius crinis-equi]|uniref:Uncharacterized protein n=1 Tax=Marasmius crinis-equi TaxID=585013 RepID=A0ABR3EL99_9AGAR
MSAIKNCPESPAQPTPSNEQLCQSSLSPYSRLTIHGESNQVQRDRAESTHPLQPGENVSSSYNTNADWVPNGASSPPLAATPLNTDINSPSLPPSLLESGSPTRASSPLGVEELENDVVKIFGMIALLLLMLMTSVLLSHERQESLRLEQLLQNEIHHRNELENRLERLENKLEERIEEQNQSMAFQNGALAREIAQRISQNSETTQALATMIHYIEAERKRRLDREQALGYPGPPDSDRIHERRALFTKIMALEPPPVNSETAVFDFVPKAHGFAGAEMFDNEQVVRELFERE